MLTENFDIQVDEDTITQSTLLHSDIPGYDLPAIDFVSPSEVQEGHILKEQDILFFFKYAETWQSVSVICSYEAFLCDILLIVTFIAFFLKYHKTMQAMLAAFITTNMTGIPPSKANPIDRMFPHLFTLNLPKEDQIIKDLEDIEGMQTMIQVISFIVCAIIVIIILYQIFK